MGWLNINGNWIGRHSGQRSWSSYWSSRWYGIEIDESNSSPDVTRIEGANAAGFHATLPVHAKLKACLLKDDGTVNYYLDPTDWSKKSTGEASSLDGTDGQVMIEWPDFWYKVEENTPSAGKHQIKICEGEATDFTLVPKHYISAFEAAIQRSTNKLCSLVNSGTDYRGGNNTSAWDSAANTLLGRPVSNVNRTNGRTYARNRGTRWNLYGYNDHKWLFWFFAIEYATLNSQKAVNATLTAEGYKQGGLGEGVTSADPTEWNNFNTTNPFVRCGASNALASGSGEVNYIVTDFGGSGVNRTFTVNRYRGHEMPFGHLYKICDGINIDVKTVGDGDTSTLYSSNNPTLWNDINYTGFNNKGNISRANNFLNKVLLGSEGEIIGRIGGVGSVGSLIYFCDYYYTTITSTSLRMLMVGGVAYSSVYAGLALSNVEAIPAYGRTWVGLRIRFE